MSTISHPIDISDSDSESEVAYVPLHSSEATSSSSASSAHTALSSVHFIAPGDDDKDPEEDPEEEPEAPEIEEAPVEVAPTTVEPPVAAAAAAENASSAPVSPPYCLQPEWTKENRGHI